MGCRLWGHTESDMTEATEQQQQQQPSESLADSAFPLCYQIWDKKKVGFFSFPSLTEI